MKKNFFQFYTNNIFFVHDVIIGIFLFAAFFPLFSRLIAYGWDTADYVHAYFVLPISLTILWIRRKQLVRREGFGFKSFLLFLLSLGIYIFSSIEGFIFLETFSFVLMISAIFYLRFTRESIKTISFPLWYLIFLVPPPSIAIDMITFPLRKISVYGSKIFLDFFNLPVR
ncbi:exosortase/archaeosortase family protein, partial [bacterium]|nr:exosortase/archaeosortase family protein [bacterium]